MLDSFTERRSVRKTSSESWYLLRGGASKIYLYQNAFIYYQSFLRATAVPAGTAEARISYGNAVCLSVRLSVCLSVTTRW